MEIKEVFTKIWFNILLYSVLSFVWSNLMNINNQNMFGSSWNSVSKQDYVNSNDPLGSVLDLFNNKSSFTSNSLDEVIGLESVKDELYYYFDFINNYKKYKEWNVQTPKGILLVGPPGTGKTLLVKSIAKNSGIPVIHTTGSDFVEMYVGLGASRVRSLFDKARKYEKCIIFIDEIDAVGKKRGIDGNSEREQTLNQLLTEMDGFKDITKDGGKSKIIIFAATNLVENLDPALLRSGRFDKKVYFDLPNKEEREELFNLYILGIEKYKKFMRNNKNYTELEIDHSLFNSTYLSELSVGLSGADISNVINQAKINAIKNGKLSFNNSDIIYAIDEIMIGREKPERKLSYHELVRVSYHEAGHAFMSFILNGIEPPIKISILPRGQAALGFSMQRPNDMMLQTEDYFLKQILVLLAGRTSEKIFFNSLSSGAHDDIQKVTKLSELYFKELGMSSEYGPLNLKKLGETNFENFGNKSVNEDIIVFIKNIEKICFSILNNNKESLKIIANLLLEKETIYYDDLFKNLNNTLENSVINF